MKNKFDFPLVLHESLEPFIANNHNGIVRDYNCKNLLRFIPIYHGSNFFFEVIDGYLKNGIFLLTIEFAPSSYHSCDPKRVSYSSSEAYKNFKDWVSLVIKYPLQKTVFDDPIINSYQKQFFVEFTLNEEDYINPLTIQESQSLIKYLEAAKEKLTQETKLPNDISDVTKEIEDLQHNIAKETKANAINKLTFIWAKLYKVAPQLYELIIKPFIQAAAQELTKQLMNP
jgi:hypothetical protein